MNSVVQQRRPTQSPKPTVPFQQFTNVNDFYIPPPGLVTDYDVNDFMNANDFYWNTSSNENDVYAPQHGTANNVNDVYAPRNGTARPSARHAREPRLVGARTPTDPNQNGATKRFSPYGTPATTGGNIADAMARTNQGNGANKMPSPPQGNTNQSQAPMAAMQTSNAPGNMNQNQAPSWMQRMNQNQAPTSMQANNTRGNDALYTPPWQANNGGGNVNQNQAPTSMPSWMQANNSTRNNQNQTPASQMPVGSSARNQTTANWTVEKASNIVILGPSGGGKTSFLNFLLNFDQIVDNDHDLNKFQAGNRVEFEANLDQNMASKTQEAHQYSGNGDGVKLGRFKYHLIDTPGFGDTQGLVFDEKHAKTIVKTIGDTEDVKAIIIVVNGSKSRMDSTLANVLYHITTVLPKAILDNIFLVMTNVSNMLQANFDIEELQKKFGIKVKDSCCIQNPFVSLERSRKKGMLIGNDDKVTKALYRSFRDARDEFMELIQKIEGCKVVESRKFTELASLKEAVERNILSIWADCDKVKIIMDQIRQFENEVMKAENVKDINMHWAETKVIKVPKLQPTDYHNTLCGHPQCYSNCHLMCRLPMTLEPGKFFLKCAAFGGHDKCQNRECKHGPDTHYHNKAKWVKVDETTDLIDDNMKEAWSRANSEAEQKQALLDGLRAQRIQKEKEIADNLKKVADALDRFGNHAVTRSFLEVLRSQERVVEERIKNAKFEAGSKKILEGLEVSLKGIQVRIQVVENSLNKNGRQGISDMMNNNFTSYATFQRQQQMVCPQVPRRPARGMNYPSRKRQKISRSTRQQPAMSSRNSVLPNRWQAQQGPSSFAQLMASQSKN